LRGTKLENANDWGDSFGAFNALVGALGFSAVIATLIVQASALRTQQKDQQKQRFDTTFFELLKLMRELGQEVRYQYSPNYKKAVSKPGKLVGISVLHGHSAVRAAVIEIRYWILEARKSNAKIDSKVLSEIYTKNVHGRYESRLGPYFRLIYTILARIKSDKSLNDSDKASYGNILRSQLSSYELSLIAFNALAPVAKDLSDLITEFHFLKYLPSGSTRRALEGVYKVEAFQARD